MTTHHANSDTLIGTIGGTAVSIFASIDTGDVVKTVILAVVGATTSFLISILLKKFSRWLK